MIHWVLIGLLIWSAIALPIGVLIGRAIRLADRREVEHVAEPAGSPVGASA